MARRQHPTARENPDGERRNGNPSNLSNPRLRGRVFFTRHAIVDSHQRQPSPLS